MSKKIDKKLVGKTALMKMATELFAQKYEVEDGDLFGKSGSIIVHMEATDIQIKFISPKASTFRYAKEEVEKEDQNIKGG